MNKEQREFLDALAMGLRSEGARLINLGLKTNSPEHRTAGLTLDGLAKAIEQTRPGASDEKRICVGERALERRKAGHMTQEKKDGSLEAADAARPAVRSAAWLGYCRCCGRNVEVRDVNLYVYGSEGLQVCHQCEMSIVEYVRHLMGVGSRARIAGYKAAREVAAAKAAVA